MSRFGGLIAHVGRSTDHGDPRTIVALDNAPLPLPITTVDGRIVGKVEVVSRMGTEVRGYGEIEWPEGEHAVAAFIKHIAWVNDVPGDLTGTLAGITVLAVSKPGDPDGPLWDDATIHVSAA